MIPNVPLIYTIYFMLMYIILINIVGIIDKSKDEDSNIDDINKGTGGALIVGGVLVCFWLIYIRSAYNDSFDRLSGGGESIFSTWGYYLLVLIVLVISLIYPSMILT